MIKLPKNIKYLFDISPKEMIKNEDTNDFVELAKLVYVNFRKDEIDFYNLKQDDEWGVINIDGNIENCALDNLELVIFVDDIYEDYNNKINTYKKENVSLKDKVKTLESDLNVEKEKKERVLKQVEYENKQYKNVCKELKETEKEIRRLFDIIEQNNK